jgi:hypothetical protein
MISHPEFESYRSSCRYERVKDERIPNWPWGKDNGKHKKADQWREPMGLHASNCSPGKDRQN